MRRAIPSEKQGALSAPSIAALRLSGPEGIDSERGLFYFRERKSNSVAREL
jgi:hypothetical protein